jgi:hypothetical protein
VTVTIPANATASVHLPPRGLNSIRESGEDLWENGSTVDSDRPGIEAIDRRKQSLSVDIESGHYEFELGRSG